MKRLPARRPIVATLLTTGVVVVGLITVYAVVPLTGRGQVWGVTTGLAAMISVIPVLIGRIRAVLCTENPLAQALAAIILTTTMLVVGSASMYFTMASNSQQFDGLETKVDAVYFAVVVMSTVGFGDITPAGQAARLATTVHIVFNIAFLGAAIRLITWATRRRMAEVDIPRRSQ